MKLAVVGCLALVAALFAGCAAKPLEVSSITKINAPAGTQGVDIYASRRQAGEAVPAYAGDQLLDIRTYAAKEVAAAGLKAGDEMPGAQCRVEASDFSADVVTPAKIRVPLYRAESSPLSISCSKPGFGSKSHVVEVYNATHAERRDMASSAGAAAGAVGVIASLLIAEAVNASSDTSTNHFKYLPVKLQMEPQANPKAPRKAAAGASALGAAPPSSSLQ